MNWVKYFPPPIVLGYAQLSSWDSPPLQLNNHCFLLIIINKYASLKIKLWYIHLARTTDIEKASEKVYGMFQCTVTYHSLLHVLLFHLISLSLSPITLSCLSKYPSLPNIIPLILSYAPHCDGGDFMQKGLRSRLQSSGDSSSLILTLYLFGYGSLSEIWGFGV